MEKDKLKHEVIEKVQTLGLVLHEKYHINKLLFKTGIKAKLYGVYDADLMLNIKNATTGAFEFYLSLPEFYGLTQRLWACIGLNKGERAIVMKFNNEFKTVIKSLGRQLREGTMETLNFPEKIYLPAKDEENETRLSHKGERVTLKVVLDPVLVTNGTGKDYIICKFQDGTESTLRKEDLYEGVKAC